MFNQSTTNAPGMFNASSPAAAPAVGGFGFGAAPAAAPAMVPIATQPPVVLVDLGAKVDFLRRKKDEMEVHIKDKSKSSASESSDAIVIKAGDSSMFLRDSVSEGSEVVLPFRNAPRSTARILPRGYHRSINSNATAQGTPTGTVRTPQSGSKNSLTTTVRSSAGILSPDVLRSRNTLRLVIDQTPTAASPCYNDPTEVLPVPSGAGRSVAANGMQSFASPSADLFNRANDDSVKKSTA